ncbi:uncharacterized protein VTP21DRAFT_8834 [Calcarisporiella thermophila]|uniref:uncharacterized protein n=1 Tax=Calcarisporiella thermophila TaxID=911321 RepID=UPI0037428C2C
MRLVLYVGVLILGYAGVYAQDYSKLVPLPGNLGVQNGLTYCPPNIITSILGTPCTLKPDCSPVTNPKVKRLLVTGKVGHITLYGLKPAIEAAVRALVNVQKEKPDLFKALGYSGMLCCRLIRGSSTSPSNHSWGTAIDFNINGKLDPRGDGKTQQGMLELYPYFNKEGFYWGGGFSSASEDSMHFEVAEQTLRRWQSEGKFD